MDFNIPNEYKTGEIELNNTSEYKMKPIEKNKDVYEDLSLFAKKIYGKVKTSNKDVQLRLTKYTPKPFGEKKTYSQDWPLYQKACSREKLMFFKILKEAVDDMMIKYEYKGNGRPPVCYANMVKCLCIKSYHNTSSWRAESELRIAKAMGIIDAIPSRQTLLAQLQNPKITTILHELYKMIAKPLSEVELCFAVDASGISNKYGNTRWIKIRNTKHERSKWKDYSKLHIIAGVKTNIICSAKITEGKAHDSPFFKGLVEDTSKRFYMEEVSADAGYISRKNVMAVVGVGAVPYIMGRKNINVPMKGPVTAWGAMLRLWKTNQMFFAERYHLRSNVESTFGMLKRKFGDFCRCRRPISQENEILCKIVCHNSAVLSKALLTYDLKSDFIDSL